VTFAAIFRGILLHRQANIQNVMPDSEMVPQFPIYIRGHSESFASLQDQPREKSNHHDLLQGRDSSADAPE
jgi:hypothetical protein